MRVGFPLLGQVGRLGNQLWQVASTAGLAAKHKADLALPPSWDYRPFFSVPDWAFSEPQSDDVNASDLVPHLGPAAKTYLQDYALFRDIELIVKEWFRPSPLARTVLEDPSLSPYHDLPRDVLSIHVRRGDNVPGADPGCSDKQNYHPLRPLSYYETAVNAQWGLYESIAVFSDDPDWCRESMWADYYHVGVPRVKEHLPGYKDGPILDWIDLLLMAEADRHIISNSTYSWWGAFLSGDMAPIYPWPWFGPRLSNEIDASLMFPHGWIRWDH